MARDRVTKEIDRVYDEINDYVQEIKDPRERINFNRKQLKFLKADVHKPKIPFRRCMLSIARKKERRQQNILRKQDVGFNRMKTKKK